MYGGGSYLRFPIDTKKNHKKNPTDFVKENSRNITTMLAVKMILRFQIRIIWKYFSESKIALAVMLNFWIKQKWCKMYQDYPNNISTKIGFNWIIGLWEMDWNVKSLQTTDAKWWQYLIWPIGSGVLKIKSRNQETRTHVYSPITENSKWEDICVSFNN